MPPAIREIDVSGINLQMGFFGIEYRHGHGIGIECSSHR